MICFIWTVAPTQDIILILSLEEVAEAASSTSGHHLDKHLITPELMSESIEEKNWFWQKTEPELTQQWTDEF